MNEELKLVNCGCGGKAFHDTTRGWNPVREDALVIWHRVICKNCGTQTKAFYTEAEAIQAWNRAMRRVVYILPNTSEDKGEIPFCPHCGDELEWE